MVAILDALGASSFREEEIDKFIDSQEIILHSLNEKADAIWGEELRPEMVTTFTFNDTIVIALTLGACLTFVRLQSFSFCSESSLRFQL